MIVDTEIKRSFEISGMQRLHIAEQHSAFEETQIHPIVIIIQPVILSVVFILLPIFKYVFLAFFHLLARITLSLCSWSHEHAGIQLDPQGRNGNKYLFLSQMHIFHLTSMALLFRFHLNYWATFLFFINSLNYYLIIFYWIFVLSGQYFSPQLFGDIIEQILHRLIVLFRAILFYQRVISILYHMLRSCPLKLPWNQRPLSSAFDNQANQLLIFLQLPPSPLHRRLEMVNPLFPTLHRSPKELLLRFLIQFQRNPTPLDLPSPPE